MEILIQDGGMAKGVLGEKVSRDELQRDKPKLVSKQCVTILSPIGQI